MNALIDHVCLSGSVHSFASCVCLQLNISQPSTISRPRIAFHLKSDPVVSLSTDMNAHHTVGAVE